MTAFCGLRVFWNEALFRRPARPTLDRVASESNTLKHSLLRLKNRFTLSRHDDDVYRVSGDPDLSDDDDEGFLANPLQAINRRFLPRVSVAPLNFLRRRDDNDVYEFQDVIISFRGSVCNICKS